VKDFIQLSSGQTAGLLSLSTTEGFAVALMRVEQIARRLGTSIDSVARAGLPRLTHMALITTSKARRTARRRAAVRDALRRPIQTVRLNRAASERACRFILQAHLRAGAGKLHCAWVVGSGIITRLRLGQRWHQINI